MKWGIHFDIARKEEKIAELEYKMGEPTFWDNPETAQAITQELNGIKSGVDTYKNLVAKYDDAQTLLELALEEDDSSQEADIAAEISAIKDGLENLRLEILLSEPYDANIPRSSPRPRDSPSTACPPSPICSSGTASDSRGTSSFPP